MADDSVFRVRIDQRTNKESLGGAEENRDRRVRCVSPAACERRGEVNPNAESVGAMKAARRSELVKAGKPDKLLRSLNAGG